jgi:hypothetical protein
MSGTSGQLSEAFSRVNPLMEEQRDGAYENARVSIAGIKPTQGTQPTLDDFRKKHTGRVSPGMLIAIDVLVAALMLFAFCVSAMRIHATALEGAKSLFENDVASQYWTALFIVFLAETCQIVFSIAFATTNSVWQKIAYAIGAAFGTLIALYGNGAKTEQGISQEFALLVTYVPPVLTLIAAQVLKSHMLHAIENRTEANAKYEAALSEWQRNYENALAEWTTRHANATEHADWTRQLANALRNALRMANRQSPKVMRELTQADWYALIVRERNASEWWRVAETQVQQEAMRSEAVAKRIATQRNGVMSTGSTGEVNAAECKRNGDAFIKVCPQCTREFEGDTERSATNKLVAHMKAHKNERKGIVADANAVISNVGQAVQE